MLFYRTASIFGFYKEKSEEIKHKSDLTSRQIKYAENLQKRFKKGVLTQTHQKVEETLHLASLRPSDDVLDKHCKKLTSTNRNNTQRDELELTSKLRPLNPIFTEFNREWAIWRREDRGYEELREKLENLHIRSSAARNHWSLHKPINLFGHEIKEKNTGKTVVDIIRHGIYDISLQKYREDFIQMMKKEYQKGMVEKEKRTPDEYKHWHGSKKYVSKKMRKKLVEYGVLEDFYAKRFPKTELASLINKLTYERDYVLRAQLASVLMFAIKRIVSNDDKCKLATERGRFLLVEWFLVSDRWKKESIMLSFLDIASKIASRAKIEWVDNAQAEGYSREDENYICGQRPFILRIKKPRNWNERFPTSICHVALNTPVHWLDGSAGYLKSKTERRIALKNINQMGISILRSYSENNGIAVFEKISEISKLVFSSSRDKRVDALAKGYQLVQELGAILQSVVKVQRIEQVWLLLI